MPAMTEKPKDGQRIAKVLARRGIGSRRAVEAMISEGRIAMNGKVVESPALNVSGREAFTLDGAAVPDAPEPPRLWLYHKPASLVTTEKDEKGRKTVFDALPEDMPRVLSVGRLDFEFDWDQRTAALWTSAPLGEPLERVSRFATRRAQRRRRGRLSGCAAMASSGHACLG